MNNGCRNDFQKFVEIQLQKIMNKTQKQQHSIDQLLINFNRQIDCH